MKKIFRIFLPILILAAWLQFRVEDITNIDVILSIAMTIFSFWLFAEVSATVFLPIILIPFSSCVLALLYTLILLTQLPKELIWIFSIVIPVALSVYLVHTIRKKWERT